MKAVIYRQTHSLENSLSERLLQVKDMDVVVKEADDERVAMKEILSVHPDLLFYVCSSVKQQDLRNIQDVKQRLPYCAVIVVGDQASFPELVQLLRLHIFDYLLAPFYTREVDALLQRARHWVEDSKRQQHYHAWLYQKFAENHDSIQLSSLQSWLSGKMEHEQMAKEAHYFNLDLQTPYLFMIIKPMKWTSWQADGWEFELAYFAVKNVAHELLSPCGGHLIFKDGGEHFIVMASLTEVPNAHETVSMIKNHLKSCISPHLAISYAITEDTLSEVPILYPKMTEELKQAESITPVVQNVKGYIDEHYNETLRLNTIAGRMRMSSAYLSGLIKRELGMSFIEYVTKVRIEMAIHYMSDPTCKIYEVAGRVGFQSQHYFSTSFKKFTGVSPSQYLGKRAASTARSTALS
ncbi:helix-turn-helix domain-containing protein [Paenibacillus hexagrammi]|uniref:Helix-turn-helix domain-containing protein n=1 Tax=Paenibacillus hexagrammi TaxID=2908839 RepID=A0ABY3SP61_9BACL|nr:helix-turn-helix domain-containing protein [Paenibacillus sp. YPD9-1]UJF35812.1 helix-turn-helix domain-containing protein [Paenibacillus sp. YPD9-1]